MDYEWRENYIIKATEFPIKIDVFDGRDSWRRDQIRSLKTEVRDGFQIYLGECPTEVDEDYCPVWVEIFGPRVMPFNSLSNPKRSF